MNKACYPRPSVTRVSAVDVRDIAAVAAVALAETPTRRRHLHHHQPSRSHHAEIADAIAAATGRTVTFVDVPPNTFAASLRGLLPDWQVDGLLEDYAHYSRGEVVAYCRRSPT